MYCPDLVHQGFGTLHRLANSLLCVAKSLKITNIHAIKRLDLSNNYLFSFAVHFHHGLLGQLPKATAERMSLMA